MNLTLKIGTLCLLLLSFSCVDKKKEHSKSTEIETVNESLNSTKTMSSENKTTAIYFRASGTEPFWTLELSNNQIKLITITDSIVAPYTGPAIIKHSSLRVYEIQTKSSQLNIQIDQLECNNAMSGNVSPYTVIVEYKKNTESSLHNIQGYGNDITYN
ncbi:hypothetical protein [Formosa sp. PL04]|uniref:hypothetical protein n=1 Tax=Formosa sp. PL04 TaxID=3081755 RepID=UPI002981FDF9|nr:hypothetical protein [Formosa sp. PL04]MDW5290360.1 hypothetical protein [Formosa sp. PL04]